jgi:hypothetical protein
MMQISIMMKAPRIMLEPPRIMVKAPRIMMKAPRIMVKARAGFGSADYTRRPPREDPMHEKTP